MSKIPKPLPYPHFFEDRKQLKGQLIYVIEPYPLSGVSLTIDRPDNHLRVRYADFAGNLLNPLNDERCSDVSTILGKILTIIVAAKIPVSQWYISNDMIVDVRKDYVNFLSPGFIRDLCGKMVATQKVTKIGIYDDCDEFNCAFLKPAKFNTAMQNNELVPLYVKRI